MKEIRKPKKVHKEILHELKEDLKESKPKNGQMKIPKSKSRYG